MQNPTTPLSSSLFTLAADLPLTLAVDHLRPTSAFSSSSNFLLPPPTSTSPPHLHHHLRPSPPLHSRRHLAVSPATSLPHRGRPPCRHESSAQRCRPHQQWQRTL
ncbi:putative proline-rich receptor-like protein kinase PERK13 [Iris pallida]|uniref:Proline-rich receptor-like protein kinase PERK13 n=1 Tax=Iris pallida TaxID=29817 RepID=A0AAX6I977_IRIPA|nr:putative proline-rich receptor-like protein kinase PERK13 [Iris pallida]